MPIKAVKTTEVGGEIEEWHVIINSRGVKSLNEAGGEYETLVAADDRMPNNWLSLTYGLFIPYSYILYYCELYTPPGRFKRIKSLFGRKLYLLKFCRDIDD
jgi:hypothetical protein